MGANSKLEVMMGAGDTGPAGSLESAQLIVTMAGRAAVSWGLHTEKKEEGYLDALSKTAREMHRKLTEELG